MALANLSEHILDRHFAILQDQRAGRRSANAKLMFLCSHRKAGRSSFDQKGRELLPIDLGKDCEQVGHAAFEIHIFSPFNK